MTHPSRFRGWRSLLWTVVVLLLCIRHATAQPPPTLTTVEQVHRISPERARQELPIHLKGVVTALSSWPNAFFFQDRTGGISVEADHPTRVYVGTEIELGGHTGPGLFAPVIKAHTVRVLRRGKLPPDRLFTYQELSGGGKDSNWINVQGVVRSIKLGSGWGVPQLEMTIEVDGKTIVGFLLDYRGVDPERMIDAVIRARGVCTTAFNDKRQFSGLKMSIPSVDFITIEEPPSPDPYQIPVVPVRSLLQFKPGVPFVHRTRIVGTVTFQDPGRSLYVQDGTDGVLVETDQATQIPLGTRVTAVGFPAAGAYSPILRQAAFRVLRAEPPLPPASITGANFLHNDKFVTAPYDAQLVRIQGQVVEKVEGLNGDIWLLREGTSRFTAVLPHRAGDLPVPPIESGSTVAATGVFSVQVDENGNPAWFRVLLRDPADLVVVKHASWWSAKHALGVVAALLVATLAVALWGSLLRKTVRKQTQMLRESEERFRRQAQQDALTGLASRSYLCERLTDAVKQARQTGQRLGVLMVDLDHFKQVNDTLGHHAGDELLRLVAGRLRASVRKGDTVARMGGDEFVVLLADLRDETEAAAIGAQVVANVSQPADIAGRHMTISGSVGVCLYPEGGTEENALLQNVDAAMYKAKAAGRNSFSVYAGATRTRREDRKDREDRENLKDQLAHR